MGFSDAHSEIAKIVYATIYSVGNDLWRTEIYARIKHVYCAILKDADVVLQIQRQAVF